MASRISALYGFRIIGIYRTSCMNHFYGAFVSFFNFGNLCSLKLHEEAQTYFITITNLIFNFSAFVLV